MKKLSRMLLLGLFCICIGIGCLIVTWLKSAIKYADMEKELKSIQSLSFQREQFDTEIIQAEQTITQLSERVLELKGLQYELATEAEYQRALFCEKFGTVSGQEFCLKKEPEIEYVYLPDESKIYLPFGDNEKTFDLYNSSPHERWKELVEEYGLNPETFYKIGMKYGVDFYFLFAVTVAETSGCTNGAGKANCGSVGSNDRGDRPTYATLEAGLEDMGKVFVNKYQKNKQTVGDFSRAGNCQIDCQYIYASSEGNWEKNVLNTLSVIFDKPIGADYNVRNPQIVLTGNIVQ